MTGNIEVSVITPLYNSESKIASTIISVRAQSLSDWEMIIVDDCSTDNSIKICEEYAQSDSRIRLICLESNSGAAVARNTAIRASKGRFIAFLDADDQWLPDKLQKQIAFMKVNNYSFSHTWYQPIDNLGVPKGRILRAPSQLTYKQMLKSCKVGCLTAIYDSDKLGKVYMPLIRKRQDYGLWLKLLKLTPYVYCYPECLSLYTVSSGSISSNKFKLIKFNWELFRKEENMGRLHALFYLSWNIFERMCKYFSYRN